ncbi:Starch-binding associating with outer membrane [Mucilaginibacter pineti]|uniref:Starch-binding associating with outer membrane n=1 Tax=Mucilaginibacter pineti TaxID=1391627 RepID=A0A1G7E0Y4_9SPHI|nr:RagB/SusD family nutrient uptake outer membrane protein [Mucilaginibacter pineti]SDE57378.1 Starch-binding associating with outer membrane [Mucilaginibacter pineti]
MKKIKYTIIALSTLIVLFNTSCKKQLDIKPESDVEADLAIKNSKDVEGVLIGAYTAAGLRGIYGGRLQATTEFLANDGDFSFYGTYSEYTELSSQAPTITNAFISDLWNAGFNTIGVCNTVLAHLDLVDTAKGKRVRVEAEAKFLRGMTYFDLARSFGRAWNDDHGSPTTNPAVPIVLTPTTTIPGIQKPSRSTVAQVYAQAISDLTAAEANLEVAKSTYASSSAASAILARIYLTQENYTLAETEATKVIDAKNNGNIIYSLVNLFADEFQYPGQATHVFNTTEDIFAIQMSSQSGFNALNEIFASADFGGRSETYINQQHFDRYETGDDRLNEFYDEDGLGDILTSKFNNQYGNVVLIRLAEIYLIRAEARIKKGAADLVGAAADINIVRKRAKLENTTATSAVDLFEAVKHERRVELAFEGFRLFDLKRYKESIPAYDSNGDPAGTIDWDSPKLVYPIPKRERDTNPNLTQNEGYQ